MMAVMWRRQDLALAELRHRVWAAERQLQRFTTAYLQDYGSAAAHTTINGPERIYSNTSSDLRLLCHVTNEVIEARTGLVKSVNLPGLDERTTTVVRLLRDIHANWDVNRRVQWQPAPLNKRDLSKEARAFIRAFPNRDPFSLILEAGNPVVADLLDLNDLSSHLFELERAISQLEAV